MLLKSYQVFCLDCKINLGIFAFEKAEIYAHTGLASEDEGAEVREDQREETFDAG